MPWRNKLTDYDIRRIYSGELSATDAGVSKVTAFYIRHGMIHHKITGAAPQSKKTKTRIKL